LPQAPRLLLRDRIRTFFRHLSFALAGEPEGIHQMRVAGRRLRTVLSLVAQKPDGRRVRRARRTIKALVRAAAPARDRDVCLALFDEQRAAVGAAPGDVAGLRRRLAAARSRSRRRMRDVVLDQDIAALRRDLRVVLGTAETAAPAVLTRIREARDLGGEALLAGLEALGDRFDADELHDLRRQVRRLRYVAEAADELGGESKASKRLKRLQEQLGDIHDPAVLAAWLGRQTAAAEKRQQPERAAEARRLEASFVEQAQSRHAAFLEQDPVAQVKHALVLLAPAAPWPDQP
jgi:CHAD domain-containing protein